MTMGTGNKRVLAIKLAFKQLPKDVDVLDGLMETVEKTTNKKKKAGDSNTAVLPPRRRLLPRNLNNHKRQKLQ